MAWACRAEPERQFQILENHIKLVRTHPMLRMSPVLVIVERNLGFEAEHMARELRHLRSEKVSFWYDHNAERFGVLTTQDVKLGAMTLVNVMLREQRICMLPESRFVSLNAFEERKKLKAQLNIYSFQFKLADTVFQKDRWSLSGKVGGNRDDIAIALQLGAYW